MFDFPQESVAEVISKIDTTHTHGAHKGTSLEWWYLTGPLWKGDDCQIDTGLQLKRTPDYGFQKTFFYVGQGNQTGALVHSAESRIVDKKHTYNAIAQSLPVGKMVAPLIRIAQNWLDLRIADQSLIQLGNQASSRWELRSRNPDSEYRLSVKVDSTSLWKHGVNGVLKKTNSTGNVYVSLPYLPVYGVRHDLKSDSYQPVCGSLWFDHEIGVQSVDKVQWNWFALRDAAGLAYMIYEISHKPDVTKVSEKPNVTLRGEYFDFKTKRQGHLEALSVQSSNPECLKSKNCYPQQFELNFKHPFKGANETLKVKPYFAEQEVNPEGLPGKTYWEGLVKFEGSSGVTGNGYLEMARG